MTKSMSNVQQLFSYGSWEYRRHDYRIMIAIIPQLCLNIPASLDHLILNALNKYHQSDIEQVKSMSRSFNNVAQRLQVSVIHVHVSS